MKARMLRYQVLLSLPDLTPKEESTYSRSNISTRLELERMEQACKYVDTFNPVEFSLTARIRSGSM